MASKLVNLRAVVIHSGILSGIRVLYPIKMTFWFDIFKGTSDEVVDWTHGKQLWENCKEKYEPLWVKGGGHCDLEGYPEYLKHMRKFLNAMEKRTTIGDKKEQLNQNSNENESKQNKCLGFG
ncbi:hypothetical protein PIB30_091586 [Stylosanthes scabra]|uniref:Uncharacterized protein n=1 Tax=Stylosanthes scabra TaxID=79078 RepID=A0ABU6YU67_9FABA|nr:hypothetical protein [Stylosanthes scabra]